MPSSANNLTGIKPTWGRVSRHGLIPMGETYDHVGPMARSAADAAAVLQAIAGADPRDPTALLDPVPDYMAQMHSGIAGLTLGIDWTYAADGIDPRIVAVLEAAAGVLERAGARVREVAFPYREDQAMAIMGQLGSEIALVHSAWFPAQEERYGFWLRGSLHQSAMARGVDVAASAIARERLRGTMAAMFAEVDLVLLPGLGRILPTWDEMDAMMAAEAIFDPLIGRFTFPFNATGTPTISLPAGFTADGLPIGIQLAGPWLSEAMLIRAGVAFQRETDFHERHPDLAA